MAFVELLFWLSLALPGYVLVRSFAVEDLPAGFLGVFSVSTLGTLALLSPICIAGHLFGAPVWLFTTGVVGLLAWAVAHVTRKGWWPEVGQILLGSVCFEFVIVCCDLLLGARVGAFLGGDARVHLARIRFILDNGLSNQDPFVAASYFFPIYHTNLLHALYASASQIFQENPVPVWYNSLPWAKLVAISGTYHMTWCVFRRSWPAYAAALCCIGIRGPFTYVNYPNQLSFLWLCPLIIGFAAEACRAGVTWATVARIGAASLVLGQFHGLFAIFSIMAVAPSLAVVAAVYFLTHRRPQARKVVACAAVMFVGLPFPYVSKIKSAPATVAPLEDVAASARSGDFTPVGNGMVMRNPDSFWASLGDTWWRVGLLILGIAIVLSGRARWPGAMVVGIMLTPLAILYIPQICTPFLRIFREEWILARLGFYFVVCHQVLMAGAVAYGLDRFSIRSLVRAPISLLALQLGGNVIGGFATVTATPIPQPILDALSRFAMVDHQRPYDWTMHFNAASAYSTDHLGHVYNLEEFRSKLRAFVPPGETILADPFSGIDLVALHDCHIIASGSASNGVLDQADRLRDVNMLLNPQLPWSARRALLQKHGIRYFMPNPQIDYKWAESHVKRYEQVMGRLLIELDIS